MKGIWCIAQDTRGDSTHSCAHSRNMMDAQWLRSKRGDLHPKEAHFTKSNQFKKARTLLNPFNFVTSLPSTSKHQKSIRNSHSPTMTLIEKSKNISKDFNKVPYEKALTITEIFFLWFLLSSYHFQF